MDTKWNGRYVIMFMISFMILLYGISAQTSLNQLNFNNQVNQILAVSSNGDVAITFMTQVTYGQIKTGIPGSSPYLFNPLTATSLTTQCTTVYSNDTGASLSFLNMAILSNGLLVAASSDEPSGTLAIWDPFAGGTLIRNTTGVGLQVILTALPPHFLVTVNQDSVLMVWDTNDDFTVVNKLANITAVSLATLPSGLIVTGGQDGTISVWDPFCTNATNALLLTMPVARTALYNVIVRLNGLVVTGSGDNSILVFDILVVRNSTDSPTALSNSQRYKILNFILSNNGTVVQDPDTSQGTSLYTLLGHTAPVLTLAQLSNGLLVSGGADKNVIVWDPSSNGPSFMQIIGFSDTVTTISPYGEAEAVAGSYDTTVKLWDLSGTGTPLNSFNTYTNYDTASLLTFNTSFVASIVNVDSNVAYNNGNNYDYTKRRNLIIWNLDESVLMPLYELNADTDTLQSLTSSRYGIVTGSADNLVNLWDVTVSLEPVAQVSMTGSVYATIELPNGWIAVSDASNTLSLLDLTNNLIISTFTGYPYSVTSLAVHFNGDLITGASDGTLGIVTFYKIDGGTGTLNKTVSYSMNLTPSNGYNPCYSIPSLLILPNGLLVVACNAGGDPLGNVWIFDPYQDTITTPVQILEGVNSISSLANINMCNTQNFIEIDSCLPAIYSLKLRSATLSLPLTNSWSTTLYWDVIQPLSTTMQTAASPILCGTTPIERRYPLCDNDMKEAFSSQLCLTSSFVSSTYEIDLVFDKAASSGVLVLYFAEFINSFAGLRVFNIFVNEQLIRSNFDIYAEVGRYNVTAVSSSFHYSPGTISISLIAVNNQDSLSCVTNGTFLTYKYEGCYNQRVSTNLLLLGMVQIAASVGEVKDCLALGERNYFQILALYNGACYGCTNCSYLSSSFVEVSTTVCPILGSPSTVQIYSVVSTQLGHFSACNGSYSPSINGPVINGYAWIPANNTSVNGSIAMGKLVVASQHSTMGLFDLDLLPFDASSPLNPSKIVISPQYIDALGVFPDGSLVSAHQGLTLWATSCFQGGVYCLPSFNVPIVSPPGYFSTPFSSVVSPCPAGYYCPNYGMTAPVPCPSGTYSSSVFNPAVCNNICSLGQYCPTGSTQASICSAGYFCADFGTQTPCSIGSHCLAGSTVQNVCPPGYYCPSPIELIRCDPTQYCQAGTVHAAPCPLGTYCTVSYYYPPVDSYHEMQRKTRWESIDQSDAGFDAVYLDRQNLDCLTDGIQSFIPEFLTPSNMMRYKFTCISLASDKFNPILMSAASYAASETDTYGNDGSLFALANSPMVDCFSLQGVITQFGLARYYTGSNVWQYAFKCASWQPSFQAYINCRTYSSDSIYIPDGPGSLWSLTQLNASCPGNAMLSQFQLLASNIDYQSSTFTMQYMCCELSLPIPIANASVALFPCLPGQYCPSGSSSPTVCQNGTYCPDGKSFGVCPIGFYCPDPSSRIVCPPGYVCPPGSTDLTPCPSGYYCPDGKIQSPCSIGQFCPPVSATYFQCVVGTACLTTMMSAPLNCPAGHYCKDGKSIEACGINYYCVDGSTKQGCPSSFTTRTQVSTSFTDCVCPRDFLLYYDSLLGSGNDALTCVNCASQTKNKDTNGNSIYNCSLVGTSIDLLTVAKGYRLYEVVQTINGSAIVTLVSIPVPLACPTNEGCLSCQANCTASVFPCSVGYEGFLCGACNDGWYNQGTPDQPVLCSKCEEGSLRWIHYLEAACAFFMGVGVLLFVSREKLQQGKELYKAHISEKKGIIEISEGRDGSLLTRLAMNHLQMIGLIGKFPLPYPSAVIGLFSVGTAAGNANLSTLSFLQLENFNINRGIRCLFYNRSIPWAINDFFDTLTQIVLQTLLILIFLWAREVWHIVRGKETHIFGGKLHIVQRMKICLVAIGLTMYPAIFQSWIRMFSCVSYGSSSTIDFGNRLTGSVNYTCFEGDHLYWVIAVGVPSLAVLILGIPICAVVLVYQGHRKQILFTDADFYATYGVLYDGYSSKYWYWEVIVLFRKIALSLIVVFLATPSSSGGSYPQGLLTVFVLFIASFLHAFLKPMLRASIDTVESLGLIVASASLYLGLWFIQLEANYSACVTSALDNSQSSSSCSRSPVYFNTCLIFGINFIWFFYVGRMYLSQKKFGAMVRAMVTKRTGNQSRLVVVGQVVKISNALAAPSHPVNLIKVTPRGSTEMVPVLLVDKKMGLRSGNEVTDGLQIDTIDPYDPDAKIPGSFEANYMQDISSLINKEGEEIDGVESKIQAEKMMAREKLDQRLKDKKH